MTRKKLPEEVEKRLAKVNEEYPDPAEDVHHLNKKSPGGSMMQTMGEKEATSIRRDCSRGEHDGEVVLKEGKGGLGLPEIRLCERCASLFVRKA